MVARSGVLSGAPSSKRRGRSGVCQKRCAVGNQIRRAVFQRRFARFGGKARARDNGFARQNTGVCGVFKGEMGRGRLKKTIAAHYRQSKKQQGAGSLSDGLC